MIKHFPKDRRSTEAGAAVAKTSSLNAGEFHFHFKRNQTDPAAAVPVKPLSHLHVLTLISPSLQAVAPLDSSLPPCVQVSLQHCCVKNTEFMTPRR